MTNDGDGIERRRAKSPGQKLRQVPMQGYGMVVDHTHVSASDAERVVIRRRPLDVNAADVVSDEQAREFKRLVGALVVIAFGVRELLAVFGVDLPPIPLN